MVQVEGQKTWSGILSLIRGEDFSTQNLGPNNSSELVAFFTSKWPWGGLHFFRGLGESLGGFIRTNAAIFQSSLGMIFHFAEFNICALTAWVFESSKDLDLHCFLLGTLQRTWKKVSCRSGNAAKTAGSTCHFDSKKGVIFEWVHEGIKYSKCFFWCVTTVVPFQRVFGLRMQHGNYIKLHPALRYRVKVPLAEGMGNSLRSSTF